MKRPSRTPPTLAPQTAYPQFGQDLEGSLSANGDDHKKMEVVGAKREFPPNFAVPNPAKSPAHGRYGAVLSHVEFGAGMNGAPGSLEKICSYYLSISEQHNLKH